MGEPIERALVARGRRVRVYTPYGAMLPGMAYLVRRLLENTSNESFLKASFADRAEVDELLRDPEEVGAMLFAKRRKAPAPSALPAFQNEPLTDFTRPEARAKMETAIEAVRDDLEGDTPYDCRITIDGQEAQGIGILEVCCPGDTSIRFSTATAGGVQEADRAVEAPLDAPSDLGRRLRPAIVRRS